MKWKMAGPASACVSYFSARARPAVYAQGRQSRAFRCLLNTLVYTLAWHLSGSPGYHQLYLNLYPCTLLYVLLTISFGHLPTHFQPSRYTA